MKFYVSLNRDINWSLLNFDKNCSEVGAVVYFFQNTWNSQISTSVARNSKKICVRKIRTIRNNLDKICA